MIHYKSCFTLLFSTLFCVNLIAQPTPYAGFMDGFGLQSAEISLHSSGFFTNLQFGLSDYISIGITPQPAMLLDGGRDWNAHFRVQVPVHSKVQIGLNTFFWRQGYDGDISVNYSTYQLFATYGSRTRYVGVSGGGWIANDWGHYSFTDDLSWNDYPRFVSYGGFGPTMRAVNIGVHAAYSLRHWSARMEGNYSNGMGLRMMTASPVLRYSLQRVRFEMGITWIGFKEEFDGRFFSSSNDITLSYQPVVNFHFALGKKTRRIWRNDIETAN